MSRVMHCGAVFCFLVGFSNSVNVTASNNQTNDDGHRTVNATVNISNPVPLNISTDAPATEIAPTISPKMIPSPSKNNTIPNTTSQKVIPKPIEDSHTILFLTVFIVGFLGVLIFYAWKKSKMSVGNSRYQYSVLNTNLTDPDDDYNDPLMNDINRDAEDDNFLDISNYHYSDDDVELLGSDSGDFFLNVGAPNPSVITTRTQMGTTQPVAGDGNSVTLTGARISSDLLEDSDEELLK